MPIEPYRWSAADQFRDRTRELAGHATNRRLASRSGFSRELVGLTRGIPNVVLLDAATALAELAAS